MINLKGRKALVTGATGHLGTFICHTLGEIGADLILVDLPGSNFKKLEVSLDKKWKCLAYSIPCDLESEKQRSALIQEVNKRYRYLSVLINNAALVSNSSLTGWAVPIERQSLDSWRRSLEVNLTAAFHLCQGFTSLLRCSPGASIINIASIYGEIGPNWRLYKGTTMGNPAAYAAGKGGLITLTKWLATTLAPHVRANSISLGGIYRGQNTKFVKKYNVSTPLNRMANEIDIKGALSLIASDASSYITGQNIIIDGGYCSW